MNPDPFDPIRDLADWSPWVPFTEAVATAPLRTRLGDLEEGNAQRAREWGTAAFVRADLYLCWSTTADRASAEALEARVGSKLQELWNRQGFRPLMADE